ncbi:MAG: asparagine synthase (glutamine-hydrolyzing) [Acidobacteria bacterium]|nr:MAG: asparagine synthase (glutamine-hydrolyzing) [Acidobacteriota bacterium]
MCGIAGIVSKSGAPASGATAAAMIATLRHRGPDDTGIWSGGAAALGAARLSVIDVAGGHQPIAVDAGRIVVVQNGEIYNYVELRRDLERRGRSFATASDTEVIAALYAEHGEAAFERMRGMFAIAIWDAARQRLVLARDRVGKKPLYYMQSADAFLFASEPKAILAALGRAPEVAPAPLLDFLTFGYVAGDAAIFEGMNRLQPGSLLTLDPGGAPAVHKYWTWPRDADAGMPEGEYLERLGAELDEAVRIRLRSDVPLGAFLSGGLDSATVLALMTKHSTRPVQTFSIGFGDPEYDELAAARRTASAFGADHHEWVVTPDCLDVAHRLASYYDEPFADASAIPTFFVSELARRHVTVCLTGDGGDELFAGYQPYSQALGRSSTAATRGMRALVGLGARWLPAHARGKGRLSTLALGPEAWFVWRRTVFPDYLLRRIAGADLLASASNLPERDAVSQLERDRSPLLSRLQRWDQQHYLPGDILVKVDRATMAHSLEARCPLLDHRVVEIAAQQPSWRHGSATTTKKLFKKLVAQWLPAETLSRPKMGFGVPLRRWFAGGPIRWARDILLDRRTRERGWTDSREAARLLRQHEIGARDHAKRIWTLVCLELWARAHVDRAGTREQACA